MTMKWAALAAVGLLACGCATNMRAERTSEARHDAQRNTPRDCPAGECPPPANHRQYFDQRVARYYYYDQTTGRYYWENGQPKY